MNDPGPRANTSASSSRSAHPACASSDCTTGNSVAEACAAPGPVCCHGASPGTPPPTATAIRVSPAVANSGPDISEWQPEDVRFWEGTGKKIAYRRRRKGLACRSCCERHNAGVWDARFALKFSPNTVKQLG